MTRRAVILAGAILVLLAAVVVGGRWLLEQDRGVVAVGSHAPDFEAMSLSAPSHRRTLADYKGDVLLLNIWATWCSPCRLEMPSMQKLHNEYGSRGLRIVAVSIDGPGTEQTIRAFADTFGLTFEILHDSLGSIQRTYRTTGVPETMVIARDGTIRRRTAGAELWDSRENRALVERLLAEREG